MKRFTIAALIAASPLLFAAGLASGQEEAGEVQARYTEEQAESGQRTFAIMCGGCHGADMVDIFAGYDTAETYYLFISGSMPADNPGSLSTQQYADIIAYLMREVGFPAGDEPLSPDRALLAEIIPGEGAAE